MKFIDTIKTDITWLVVQGTDAELDRLIAWTEKNRTMYVIAGKREDTIMVVGDDMNFSHRIVARLRSRMPNGIREQRFGFKAVSDALRCKLTLA